MVIGRLLLLNVESLMCPIVALFLRLSELKCVLRAKTGPARPTQLDPRRHHRIPRVVVIFSLQIHGLPLKPTIKELFARALY